MTNKEKTITIPLERFKELVRAETELNCLETFGVDNWDWYSEAMHGFGNDIDSTNPVDPSRGYYNIVDIIVEREIQKYENH